MKPPASLKQNLKISINCLVFHIFDAFCISLYSVLYTPTAILNGAFSLGCPAPMFQSQQKRPCMRLLNLFINISKLSYIELHWAKYPLSKSCQLKSNAHTKIFRSECRNYQKQIYPRLEWLKHYIWRQLLTICMPQQKSHISRKIIPDWLLFKDTLMPCKSEAIRSRSLNAM